MDINNITLDFDGDGIWLVNETFEGDRIVVKQMGHIRWSIIAIYLKGYL